MHSTCQPRLLQEIDDIDLSQIDPTAAREKVVCPRCGKEVLKEHFESHMTAHSSDARLRC